GWRLPISTSPCIVVFRRSPVRTARSGCRFGWATTPGRGSPTTCAGWPDGSADPRLVRVLSAQDRGDGEKSLGGDRAACAAFTELRLGNLRRRGLDPGANAFH